VELADTVDDLICKLYAPEGKVKLLLSDFLPDQLEFDRSVPMKKLAEHGSAIQPRLLAHLKDRRIRNEIALILEQIGDHNALPGLIEVLPTGAQLTPEEDFSSKCLVSALWRLTGIGLGMTRDGTLKYTPELRAQWQAWYNTNKDFLYTPSELKLAASSRGRNRVSVDFEAKLAATPTAAYRQEHPWVSWKEIQNWQDDPAYQRKLKSFCFSIILNFTWSYNGTPPREATRSLGRIQDSRALSALKGLCELADDSITTYDLAWTLEEKGDPSVIPYLDRILRSKNVRKERESVERKRLQVIERIQLLERHGKTVEDKPFTAWQQTAFMKCLEGPREVDAFLTEMHQAHERYALPHYLRVAGYVDQEPVRSFLKQMAGDGARNDQTKTRVHAALARLGEKNSLEYLKKSLTHKEPGVRLAAAEGLWHLGNRDGFQTLVGITCLRPIETGGEGVTTGNGAIITVTGIEGANVDHIRDACKILGEMGDLAAIEPLKKLLPLNLNGVLGNGGSGTGWSGRPDVVALARLGDFSGIEILRASIRKGDRLDVAGSWGGAGDFVEIGLKRFIPDLLSMLDHYEESKRALAAQAILLLFERGR
jgi:HEAT repeat protein